MYPTLHRRWLITSASVELLEIPNADHDTVLVTDYPLCADIAEWMTRHLRGHTTAADSQ